MHLKRNAERTLVRGRAVRRIDAHAAHGIERFTPNGHAIAAARFIFAELRVVAEHRHEPARDGFRFDRIAIVQRDVLERVFVHRIVRRQEATLDFERDFFGAARERAGDFRERFAARVNRAVCEFWPRASNFDTPFRDPSIDVNGECRAVVALQFDERLIVPSRRRDRPARKPERERECKLGGRHRTAGPRIVRICASPSLVSLIEQYLTPNARLKPLLDSKS